MVIGDRLRERMEAAGLSQSALARRLGLSQGTIAKLVVGISAGSKHLHAIARELGTTPEYLLGETDDPTEGALPSPTAETVAEQMDAVMVPLYDLGLSMGGGNVIEQQRPLDTIPFKRDFLRSRIQGRLDQVIMATARGDSMVPTISDGDMVLIDRSQLVVRDPEMIWAFGYGDVGMVKRLTLQPKGTLRVQSDSKQVRPFTARPDEVNIIGRVVSILKWQ